MPLNIRSSPVFLGALIGTSVSILWTSAGVLLSSIEGNIDSHVSEWILLQGFFVVSIGIWLTVIAWYSPLTSIIRQIDQHYDRKSLCNRFVKIGIIAFVSVLGTISLIGLGFNSSGISLAFMWLTCAVVCLSAGVVTSYSVEILLTARSLQKNTVSLFAYSPAHTKGLNDFVNHFTTFSLIMTCGYAFAFSGTLLGNWIGNELYIGLVQFFWPLVYVPFCFILIIYPHIAIRSIIRREKEKLLYSCQSQLNELLREKIVLTREDIDRSNALADLFEKVRRTPDYTLSFGIVTRTAAPVLFNILTVFVGKEQMILDGRRVFNALF